MQPTQTQTQTGFILPIAVVSPTDIARLVRELENLDEYFRQSAIRQGGTPQAAPRYSRLLDEIVVANGANLLAADHRQAVLEELRMLSMRAPVMHISFSVDPPGPYVQKIVAWLRENIHPMIIVRVGLQPNIGAGCVVRTTNRSFDFSLRQYFDSKHEFFMEKLHEVVAPELQPDEINEPVVATNQLEVPEADPQAVVVETVTEPASPSVSPVAAEPEPSTEPAGENNVATVATPVESSQPASTPIPVSVEEERQG